MSMLKKAMIYLGLGPDEHYESYEDPIRSSQPPVAVPGRYPVGAEAVPGPGVSVASGPAPGRPGDGPDRPTHQPGSGRGRRADGRS